MNKRIISFLLLLVFFERFGAFGQALDLSLNAYTGEPKITALRSITLTDGFHIPLGSNVIISTNPVPVLPALPNSNRNFIQSRLFRSSGVTELNLHGQRTAAEENRTVQYFDAIGRPVQVVQAMAGAGFKDLVQHIAFDKNGRESIKYAPYATFDGTGGTFKQVAVDSLLNFYNPSTGWDARLTKTDFPLARTVYQNSPLMRVIEQGAEGQAWQPFDRYDPSSGHSVKLAYGTNEENEVALWATNGGSGVSKLGTYAKGSLHKVTRYDENNTARERSGSVEEFKDYKGRVILRRQWKSAATSVDIFYVYDKAGNLAYVIPPGVNVDLIAEDGSNNTHDILFRENLYAYRYDGYNRLSMRKVPGKGWEWFVYNRNDKVVLSQDAVQRASGKWIYYKFDALGREVVQGIYTNTSFTSREKAQQAIELVALGVESRQDSVYTNVAFPTTSTSVRIINYYDDYTFEGRYRLPSQGVATSLKVKGLLTGTKVHQDDGSAPLLSVNYYDDEARVVQSLSQNHIGGKDIISNTYSFVGDLLSSRRVHTDKNGTATTVYSKNEYDHSGRLLTLKHRINQQDTVVLVKKEYNSIGQLVNKSVGGDQYAGNFHSNSHIRYHVRGWVTEVSSPYFSYQLKYEQPTEGAIPQFNGNIAEQHWNRQTGTSKHFTYQYDALNRLSDGRSITGGMRETLQYDDRGNITSLSRDGAALAYAYVNGSHSNRLLSVTGGASNYSYDANGNATVDRLGTIITYNHLSLPDSIRVGSVRVGYLYDAMGKKLRKYANQGGNRDYIDGLEYQGSTLEIIHTAEGVALRNANGNYTYRYNLTDHLDNVRATLYRNPVNGNIEILQQDDFYPFGKQKVVAAGINRYLYNGKEIQSDFGGQYDYGARFYDAEIGRWNVVDPLADQMRRQSPYNYGFNNPIRFIDPDGRSSIEFTGAAAGFMFEQFKRSFLAGRGSSSDENGNSATDQDPPQDPPPSWLKKVRDFQTAASNWATNGPSKWADKQSAVVTQMGQTFTLVTQGYRDYMDETAKPLYEAYGYMAMLGGNAAGWERFVFQAGINLEKSILKAMGKGYEIAGEVTVPIKNTEVLNMLNSASKGDWVKVYEAGLKNGEKMEVHYFRNNNTGQVFDVKTKYNYWHQKAFKKL